jgi:hypothetical protein
MNAETLKEMALALTLIGASIISAYSTPAIEPLGIGGDMERSLNRRLHAIAHDPSLMTRLDQKKNFRATEAYAATLTACLTEARNVLPEVFSATNMEHAVTAMCLADARVYFWLPLDDRVLVGWIPIIGKEKSEVVRNDLVFWLVPQPRKRTKLIDAWQNRATGRSDSSWLADVLKTGLGVDLTGVVLANQNKTTLQGRIVVSSVEHSIAANVTEHLVQIEISLRSNVDKELPGKPVMAESTLNDMPVVLPFWPPTEE